MMSQETQFWPCTLFSRLISVRIINVLLCLWLNVPLSVPVMLPVRHVLEGILGASQTRLQPGSESALIWACQLQIELRTSVDFSKGKHWGPQNPGLLLADFMIHSECCISWWLLLVITIYWDKRKAGYLVHAILIRHTQSQTLHKACEHLLSGRQRRCSRTRNNGSKCCKSCWSLCQEANTLLQYNNLTKNKTKQ